MSRLTVQLEMHAHYGRHPATTVALLVDEDDKVVARGVIVATDPLTHSSGLVLSDLHFEGGHVE